MYLPTPSAVRRICIFSRSFFPAVGGQERVAAILAREFTTRGYKVVILTDTPSDEVNELPYQVLRTGRFWDRVAVFGGSDRVLFMSSSLQGLLGCWLARKRCYITHQSLYGIGSGLERWVGVLKARLAGLTVNICISEFQRSRLRAPAVLIPNPVDEEFLQIPASTRRSFEFGFAGRLVSDKGVALLLEAFQRVHAVFPAARLRVIGDGPEGPALKDQARTLGLGQHVSFSGSLYGTHLSLAMAECECLVVPSVWEEPYGMAALEGMATCLQVIVTRRGALPDVVGPFGTVVDPDPDSLACAMEQFLRSPRADREGNQAKADYLRQFSSDQVAGRYLEVLFGDGHPA